MHLLTWSHLYLTHSPLGGILGSRLNVFMHKTYCQYIGYSQNMNCFKQMFKAQSMVGPYLFLFPHVWEKSFKRIFREPQSSKTLLSKNQNKLHGIFCEQLFHNCQCKSMLQLNLCLCKPFFGQLEQQTHVPSIHLQQWQQEQLKEWENNYGLWKKSLLWRCLKWCHVAPWKFRLCFEASGLPPLMKTIRSDASITFPAKRCLNFRLWVLTYLPTLVVVENPMP